MSFITLTVRLTPRSNRDYQLMEIDDTHGTTAQRAAQVHLTPKHPMLAVEDIESRLSTVICTASTIELHFLDRELLHEALADLDALPRFILVTSHIGCNDDGERKAYL